MSARRPIRLRPWLVTTLLGAVGTALVLLRPAPGRGPAAAAHATSSVSGVLADLSSVDDAARLGDGWAIVDARERALHVTDSQGNILRRVGRAGEGPGEFVFPRLVAVSDAHLYVAEMGRPTVSQFDHGGAFIGAIPAMSPCGTGTLALLAAMGTELVAVRRCLEPPRRMRLQLERLIDGALHPWGAVDTIPYTDDGVLPVSFPLLALDDGAVLFGDGGRGCLRRIDLATGAASASRCLDWMPRVPRLDSQRRILQTRAGSRVALPDSLPRIWRIAMVDSMLAAVVSEDQTRFRWVWISESPDQQGITPIGQPYTGQSFLDRGFQLVATEDDDGIHLEALRVRR